MSSRDVPGLVRAARKALDQTQDDFATDVGSSKRTVARWESAEASPNAAFLERIARLVHRKDRQLAARVAAEAGKTLVALGLESPPAPVAVPAPPPTLPSLQHLTDSIVCAAAEASGTMPQTVRLALQAAFERAQVLGLPVSKVCEGLRGERPALTPPTK